MNTAENSTAKLSHRKDRKFLFMLLFMIMAFMANGTFSFAASGAFSTKALNFKVTVSAEGVQLRAANRRGLDGFKFYITDSKGKNRKLLAKSRTCRYTYNDVYPGETYYFQVRGYGKINGKRVYTAYSKVVKAEIPVVETISTLKKLLKVGLQPLGTTLYIWGGGWGGANGNAQARSIGPSPEWKRYFKSQNRYYDYRLTRYQSTKGLDCSGYVGWCIYNIMNTTSGGTGYVMLAQLMARNFADRGWGSYTPTYAVKDYRAGDIMSLAEGHVYIVVGQCSDGSVVLMHSSPPGVHFSGTPAANGKKKSQAVKLAQQYTKKYYKEYFNRYPTWKDYYKDRHYLTDYAQMRWDLSGNSIMSDPDGYRNKSANAILKDLFK